MDFEPQEWAIVESYLSAKPHPPRRWLVTLGLGIVVTLVAIVMIAGSAEAVASGLVALVAGLVVMARALDERKRCILARVIQKYHQALEEKHQ